MKKEQNNVDSASVNCHLPQLHSAKQSICRIKKKCLLVFHGILVYNRQKYIFLLTVNECDVLVWLFTLLYMYLLEAQN